MSTEKSQTGLAKKRVVIIDDSVGPIGYYVDALRLADFEVRHIPTASEALEHIERDIDMGDLYVFDLMMPIEGSTLDVKETDYGLTTGFVLIEKFRLNHSSTPFIMLTNVTTPEIIDRISSENKIEVFSKPGTLPSDLVDVVRSLLERPRRKG